MKKTVKKHLSYSGVKVLEISKTVIDEVYKNGFVDLPIKGLFPNQFVYLKSNDTSDKAGAITVVNFKTSKLMLVKDQVAFGIKPKNKEQTMSLSALLDEEIKLCLLTGATGSGKTLLTIAAALENIDNKKYKRIIITRPMSQVGDYDLGALPGGVAEKFNPYLENYMSNIQQMLGDSRRSIEDLIHLYSIEIKPLQLIRGASWVNTFVIADEVQTLSKHEILTLGTRIGEGSKLVMMGDMNQRDEDIAIPDTGLFHVINNKTMKESPLVSHINLIKTERSQLAELFSKAFE